MKPCVPSLWGLALDHLAQARGSSWTHGATTGAAWDAVHTGEEALLAAAPCPATISEKLRYLLAVTQAPETAALRQGEQPWRHRLLRSAIADLARLGAALAAAQAEARRRHEAAGRPLRPILQMSILREQLAERRAELEGATAERDVALDALLRANQHHTMAALGIPHPGLALQQARMRHVLSGDGLVRKFLTKKRFQLILTIVSFIQVTVSWR